MSRELTRRDFLGDAALVGVASAIGLEKALASQPNAAAAPPRVRQSSFDDGWSFAKGDIVGAQAPQFTASNWTPVIIPHDWSISGPFSESEPCGSEGAYLPTGIGWYRKSFQLPRTDAGRRILLQVDGVYQCSDVWINGQHLGTRPYGFTTFYYDLTPHLHFGSEPNLVAVRVDNSHQPNLRWYSGSGINRHTWLINTGPFYIEQWGTGVTTPQITAQTATVEVSTRVRNQLAQSASCTLRSEVLDQSGAVVQSTDTDAEIPTGGGHLFVQRIAVPQPKLWSHTSPTLYSVRQVLRHGSSDADAASTSFGIRSIQFDADKGFLLNGERVKLNGVCLHDDGGAVGTAVPQRIWERRFALLKEMGCNAIRASHYPPAERFLELCDQAGFYILDEIPACWIANEVNNPSRTWAYTFRSMETLARDKNRPCVVAWSCGNESGYGINDQAEFDFVKAHDPTRLAFISQQNLDKNPKTDFEDYHYPKIDTIKSIAASPNRAKVPAFLTEYSPSGPGGVAYAWDVIWPSDGMAGAFLYLFHDQGQTDKFPERWPVHSPGAPPASFRPGSGPAVNGIPSADTTNGMRLTGGPNPVSTDRRIKPQYENLKLVYSPVNTTAREVSPVAGQCVVPLQNRYSFTDLAELTCRWQALAGEKLLAAGESHVPAKPRSTVDASFPATPGADTLRLEFIHPDGRAVYVTTLPIKN